jgi:hypothetical protein
MPRFSSNSDKVVWRVVDGEAVIVHADSSAYYGLNSTGTFIWEAMAAAPLAAEQLAARLSQRYGLEPAAARADVDAFVSSLRGEELLVETEDASDGALAPPIAGAPPAAYEPPALARFGELEQLVLSGE